MEAICHSNIGFIISATVRVCSRLVCVCIFYLYVCAFFFLACVHLYGIMLHVYIFVLLDPGVSEILGLWRAKWQAVNKHDKQ